MINKRIAIIGAGITGLTTSLELKKKGIIVDLYDKKGEPGGVIKSERDENWNYEYGPNTLLLKDKPVEDFLYDLNLGSDIKIANSTASKRFIVKDDILHSLPTSFAEFVKTPLFSTRAKWRLLVEPFYGRSDDTVTIAKFFQHRFGGEILDYAVNPFIAGIHAGRPEKLSLKHSFPMLYDFERESGSVMLGAIKKLYQNRNNQKIQRRLLSFTNGLQQLPKEIFSRLDQTYLNHDVKQVKKSVEGWTLNTQMGSFGPYSDIICTIPLHKWNRQLMPISDQQLKLVKSVEHPPLSILLLGFKKEQVTHPLDGFGFLVPEKEQRSILGGLFTSTLFEGKAPDGYHLLTIFVGGGRQPELAKLNSDELLTLVQKDLNDLIGISGDAVYKDHIFWPNSIPQYHTGYDKLNALFEDLEAENPGLYIAGNFRGGISVPDCIKNGIILAENLASE